MLQAEADMKIKEGLAKGLGEKGYLGGRFRVWPFFASLGLVYLALVGWCLFYFAIGELERRQRSGDNIWGTARRK